MQKLNRSLIKKWLLDNFPDIIAGYLFGSFAQGNVRPSSDIDIGIYVPRIIPAYELWELSQELAILLNRDVDLVNMISSNTVFQFQIISTAQLLLSTNNMKRSSFEIYIIKSYLDFAPARKRVIDAYKSRRVANG